MIRATLDEVAAALIKPLPDFSDTAIAAGAVKDYSSHLVVEEQRLVNGMPDQRIPSFSSGRYFAQQAQSLLDREPVAILRDGRVPVWPAPLSGSITHSRDLACAVVCTGALSIGIDLELSGRVTPKLHRQLFTDREQLKLAQLGADAPTIAFSAKEAVYKAAFPLFQRFIGFKEVELDLDLANGTFSATYVGQFEPQKAINTGAGYFVLAEDQLIALYVLPRG